MVINSTTTELTFYPYVSFTGEGDVTLYVYHKPTKTEATHTTTPTLTGSAVTLALPSLTAITATAADLDEVLVRVFNSTGQLLWEYVGMWVEGSINLEREWNEMTTTTGSGKQWVTL